MPYLTPAVPLLFLPSLGLGELGLIVLLVLLLFGPGKLPQVAKSLGESLKQFKEATTGAGTSVALHGTEETKAPESNQKKNSVEKTTS